MSTIGNLSRLDTTTRIDKTAPHDCTKKAVSSTRSRALFRRLRSSSLGSEEVSIKNTTPPARSYSFDPSVVGISASNLLGFGLMNDSELNSASNITVVGTCVDANLKADHTNLLGATSTDCSTCDEDEEILTLDQISMHVHVPGKTHFGLGGALPSMAPSSCSPLRFKHGDEKGLRCERVREVRVGVMPLEEISVPLISSGNTRTAAQLAVKI